jgi:exopolysaccharide biosynthesis operon protein EpsL
MTEQRGAGEKIYPCLSIARIRLRRRILWILGSALFLGHVAPVSAEDAAETPNVFSVLGGGGMEFDSNLFKLPDSVDPNLALRTSQRSDWLRQAYVGLALDKPYALQRFQLNATLYKYWYERFSYLNFDATDFNGSWLWYLTPYLSGTLTADRQQQLNSYADYTNYSQRNIQTTYRYKFTADWQAFGGWHPIGSISETGRRNSATFVQQNSYRSFGGEAGLKYVFRSGSAITAVGQRRYGQYLDQPLDYTNLVDTGFTQSGAELRLDLAAPENAPFSGLSAHAGYVSHNLTHFHERDFDTWTAHAQGAWNPTAKIQILLSAGYDVGEYTASYSSYRTSSNVSLTPSWAVTDKLALSAGYTFAYLDFKQPVVPNISARQDIQHTYQVGAEWAPFRSVQISGTVQHDGRLSSYVPTPYQYSNLAASLVISVRFGS